MKTIIFLCTLLVAVSSSFLLQAQIPNELVCWKFKSDTINSCPVVDRSTVYVGCMNGVFYAIDLNKGTEVWKQKLPFPILAKALVRGEDVFIRSGNCLYCLDKADGSVRWKYAATDKEPFSGCATVFNHSSPISYQELVYFADERGNVSGLEMDSGDLKFQYKTNKNYPKERDHIIASTPAIEDGVIYFGDHGATMYAVSLADGEKLWEHKVKSPRWDGSVISEVVIRDSVLYFGGYNNTFSPLNKKTGEPVWSFKDEMTFLPSTPVFYNNKVIIGSTINSEKIHALNIETGKEEWTFQSKGIFFVKPQIIKDSILVINSTLFPFADKIDFLYFINCKNGELIDRVNLPNPSETSAAYTGNDRFLLGTNEGLYLLKIKVL